MAEAGPHDVMLITRQTAYTFAPEANTPMRLRPSPTKSSVSSPRFADERLLTLGLHPRDQREIDSALETTDRAYVVDSRVGYEAFKQYRADLTTLIASEGSQLHSKPTIGTARISVWQPAGTESPSG